MTFATTSLAMAAVLFGVGAPVACLVLPRRWRMHWPAVAPLSGAALVSLVAWTAIAFGDRLTPGWVWSVVLVAGVAGAVVLGRDRGRAVRRVLGGFVRHLLVTVLALAVLYSLAEPLVGARLGLTTVSLGSCDAPDYAAGATLMRDVDPDDLSGFNGQTETVSLRSVDTFYGHWLRLNHFAPAALLAWFSVLFDLPIFKLVTSLGVALHASAVPAVFWLARAALRLGPAPSLAVAASWGLSAPAVYGVAQVALGQIMVVPAVAVLTWAGMRVFREARDSATALRWLPIAAIGFVVLVAAYTFALVFVLTPLAAGLVWLGWHRRAGARRLVRTTAVGAGALACVGAVFLERMIGLADRFAQFEAVDFGWYIPVFTPERWLGWFGDAGLGAGSGPWGWLLVAWVASAWMGYAVTEWRRDRHTIGVAGAWLAAGGAGYAMLAIKGIEEGSNELYNAYKVFALLQPLSLAALALPLRAMQRGTHAVRILGSVTACALVAVHAAGAASARDALRRPSLWVDKPLASIEQIAARDEVESVNMLLEPMWARLWANGMLLNKRQYFRTETYEGRRATELRGAWNLRDGLLRIHAGGADTIVLGGGYHLVRASAEHALAIDLGPGWHPPEGGGAARWCWSSGREARIEFTAPAANAGLQVTLHLQGNGSRTVEVGWESAHDPAWSGRIGSQVQAIELPVHRPGAGAAHLRIRTMEPAFSPPGDGRTLGFALHGVDVVVGKK